MKVPPAVQTKDLAQRTKAQKEFDKWFYALSADDQKLAGSIGSRFLSVKPRMDVAELAKRIRAMFEAEQGKRSA